MLLEYADRGTLEQYFKSVQPPSSGEDTIKFWRGLFKTLGALVAIHSVQPSNSAQSSHSFVFQGYTSTPTLRGDLAYFSRWHQDVKPSNILVKSKKGGSPYDCEFKLADLGLSHFKKHVPSQGEATDIDTYGTRAYGRLHSEILADFTMADGGLGAPECYRADSEIESVRFLVKQCVDIWSLGCTFSEAAAWVVHGKDGLSEYRRRRGMETARIQGFRDGDCFHDGLQVLATVTDLHKTLAEDIRARDHVTGATVEMVTKEMLIDSDSRTPAKSLSYRTKMIVQDAENKLKRHSSYAGTGTVSGTVAQSPPLTPAEPPPSHVQPRSSNSHSQPLPSHIYTGNPASTSYDEDEAYHQDPVDYFSGKGASQQAHCRNRPAPRQSTGLLNRPSFFEHEDQDQSSEYDLNRNFSKFGLSQDSTSSPSWQEPPGTHRRRRRTPSDLLSGANTRKDLEKFSPDRQENYNINQRNAFTAPPEGVSRTSTATLVPDLHNGSRARRHHPNITSETRPPRIALIDSSNVPPLRETQPRRLPPVLSLAAAQQWRSDKKKHMAVRLPDDHLLADLNERDHVSQCCIR